MRTRKLSPNPEPTRRREEAEAGKCFEVPCGQSTASASRSGTAFESRQSCPTSGLLPSPYRFQSRWVCRFSATPELAKRNAFPRRQGGGLFRRDKGRRRSSPTAPRTVPASVAICGSCACCSGGEARYFKRAPIGTSSKNAASTGLPPSSEAATIIPFDIIPRSFLGCRLATITTLRPIKSPGL